jgi:hypothetical protein
VQTGRTRNEIEKTRADRDLGLAPTGGGLASIPEFGPPLQSKCEDLGRCHHWRRGDWAVSGVALASWWSQRTGRGEG